jgi:hypothetical protein
MLDDREIAEIPRDILRFGRRTGDITIWPYLQDSNTPPEKLTIEASEPPSPEVKHEHRHRNRRPAPSASGTRI